MTNIIVAIPSATVAITSATVYNYRVRTTTYYMATTSAISNMKKKWFNIYHTIRLYQ